MNIFNDFLALLVKVALVCLLIGLCLGFWLAQKGMADAEPAGSNTVRSGPGVTVEVDRRPRPPARMLQELPAGRCGRCPRTPDARTGP